MGKLQDLSLLVGENWIGSRPFFVSRLMAAPAQCPVASMEILLQARARLGIAHVFLFIKDSPPFRQLTPQAFGEG